MAWHGSRLVLVVDGGWRMEQQFKRHAIIASEHEACWGYGRDCDWDWERASLLGARRLRSAVCACVCLLAVCGARV